MKLAIATLAMLPMMAFAQESRFLVNQEEETNQLQLTLGSAEYTSQYATGYSYEDENYGTVVYSEKTRRGTLAQLTYSNSFAELQTFAFSAELFLRQKQVSGLRSLNAAYKGGVDFETAIWVYGADLTLSPGRANFENVFRGYHTMRLNTGIETYAGPAAISANAVFNNHISANSSKDPEYSDMQTLGFETAAEMPVYKNIAAGLGLGVSRSTKNMGDPLQMLSGANENGFNSQLFSTYKMDDEAIVSLQIKNEKLAEPMNESLSSISLGYTKSL